MFKNLSAKIESKITCQLISLCFNFFAIVLLIVSPCLAEEKTILAAENMWPPFVDETDLKQGLSLVIVRAAYKTQGYNVKMEFVPWARAEALTVSGKYDILPGVWVTDERKDKLLFSEPYAFNTIKFIKRANDPFEYKGLSSLKGKIVGTVRKYGYGDEFRASKEFIREDASDFITNIKRLTAEPTRRLIDLTLEDEIVATVAIKKNDPSLLSKIKFTKNALCNKGLCIASGLKNPRHKEIIEAFNRGLAEIKTTGEFDKIFQSYMRDINIK